MIEAALSAFGVNKWVAYGVAALAVAIAAGAFALHYAHLQRDAAAYVELKADVAAIGRKYGCGSTPLGECLTNRDLAASLALIKRVTEERAAAAAEQARADQDNANAAAALKSAEDEISAAPTAADGPVPPVLLNSWRRERGSK